MTGLANVGGPWARDVGGRRFSRVVDGWRRPVRDCGCGVGQRESFAHAAQEVEIAESCQFRAFRGGEHAEPVAWIQYAAKLPVDRDGNLTGSFEDADGDPLVPGEKDEASVECHVWCDGREDQGIELWGHDRASCGEAVRG